jgi:peptidoglycan/LPS O-acetylase OafA/YrhL
VSGANVSGLIGFALAMAATLALSWMITRLIEPQIDRIREQVKLGRAARRDNGAISTRPMPAPSLPESR